MKKILNPSLVSALLLAAAPLTGMSQTSTNIFFTDNFSNGSTTNLASVPGGSPTASFTSYDIASTKNTINFTSIAAHDLKLTLSTATSSGFLEAQALFTNHAITLSSLGDFIDIQVVFTNTTGTLFASTTSALWLGLYNSGGSAPLSGGVLASNNTTAGVSVTGLNTNAVSLPYAAGGCSNWVGYVAQMTSNGISRVVTRPAQTSAVNPNYYATSETQDLVGNAVGAGAYQGGVTIETGTATPVTLTPTTAAYTMQLRLTYSGANVLTVSNILYSGVGTGGTILLQHGSTNISGANFLTSAFDGLAIGVLTKVSVNPVMDISSITIVGQSTLNTQPPSITAQPVSVTVPSGGSCAFSVAATGQGLTYQWYRNNAILNNGGNISGATTSQLVVSPVSGSDVFSGANGYYCAVTGVAFPTNLTTNSATANLALGSAKNLFWTDNASTVWDLNNAINWQDAGATPQTFNYGDTVTFDNTGAGGQVLLNGSFLSAGSVTVNSTFAYNFSSSSTGGYAGLGSLTYSGPGQLTIGNANSYSGGTFIQSGAGRLILANYGGLGTGPVNLNNPNGTMELTVSGGNTTGIGGDVNINANFTNQLDATGTYAAVILGSINGAVGQTLTFNLTNNPSTNSSRIRVYGTNGLCNANIVLTGNATNNALLGGTVLAPYGASGTQIYNGTISGPGGVVQRGAGTGVLAGPNTYTGGTFATAGTIGIGANSTPTNGTVTSGPFGTGPLFLSPEVGSAAGTGTVLAYGGARTVANPIQYPYSGTNQTLAIGGTNALTLSGAIALQGQDGGTTPTNRTFTADNTALTTFTGVISDNALGFGLTKNGSNTLVLANTETYTGPTAVTAGTLLVNGTLAAGSAVTVTNAKLGGTGIINGSVLVQSNATLTPGNGGIGTLTINNALTFSGGSTHSVEVNSSGAHDLVTGLTSVTYNGTLFATNLSGTLTSGQTFTIFSTAAHSGNFTNITGTPGTGLAWAFNPTNGVLSVVTGVSTTPPFLTNSLDATGTHMLLSWPSDHLGWTLQSQTNTLAVGLQLGSNNWHNVTGSASVTSTNIAIGTNGTVFFRLTYP